MKNPILTLFALFALALGSFAQETPRPAPPSPYSGMAIPQVLAPACYLNNTVDPACLEAAMKAYYAGVYNAADAATKSWNVAKDWYESQLANEEAMLVSCLRDALGNPSATDTCILAWDSMLIVHWNNFSAETALIYNTFGSTLSNLRIQFNASVGSCCVPLSTITDPENMAPQIEPCGMDVAQVDVMCPEGPADPACVQACKDTFNIAQSILCATYQIQVDGAYETLINGLVAADQKSLADGALCGGDPICEQMVLDTYNTSFNTLWQDFYGVYFSACQSVADEQQVLLTEMFNCAARCCP